MELHWKTRKPNTICIDKGSELYNNSFKKWLKDNDKEMYSTHNEEKSVAAEKFIRTLRLKSTNTWINYNYYLLIIIIMISINKLDGIVNEYNKTCHRIIKMKPVDVKDNAYIDSGKEVNDKDPKF